MEGKGKEGKEWEGRRGEEGKGRKGNLKLMGNEME